MALTALRKPHSPLARSGVWCPRCRAAVWPEDRFCGACGQRVKESPLIRWIIAIAASLVVSICGWMPLGWLGHAARTLLVSRDCASYQAGTIGMFLCSGKVALATLVGPTAVLCLFVLLLFAARRWGAKKLNNFKNVLPASARSAVGPAVATLFFLVGWAGVHYGAGLERGIVPQIFFPIVIGVFSFLIARYHGALIQNPILRSVFQRRDKTPRALRAVIALLVPLLVSLAIIRGRSVSAAALKQQLVVLVALALGYLALGSEWVVRLTKRPCMRNGHT